MGLFRLQINGSLGDLITHLQQLVDDLQAQGVNPSPLKQASVTINFQANITDPQNANVSTAINNWRSQTAATSIMATAEYAVSE